MICTFLHSLLYSFLGVRQNNSNGIDLPSPCKMTNLFLRTWGSKYQNTMLHFHLAVKSIQDQQRNKPCCAKLQPLTLKSFDLASVWQRNITNKHRGTRNDYQRFQLVIEMPYLYCVRVGKNVPGTHKLK